MSTTDLTVHLDGGQQRDVAVNRATRMTRVTADQPLPAAFCGLFGHHYDAIRSIHASAVMPGVSVIAINGRTGQLQARLWIAARVGQAGSAIIGRHGRADLFLADDDRLSLRHLMLVIEPREHDSDDVCFRLLDLRTAHAFEDERGQRHAALISDGPMFVRCGDYYLYLLITGEGQELPESADDGWESIPPRVYRYEVTTAPQRWLGRRRRMRQTPVQANAEVAEAKEAAPPQAEAEAAPPEPGRGDRITRVSVVRGLARPQRRLMEAGESIAGTVRIRTAAGEQLLLVGTSALRRGILIGRYERCDIEDSSLLYNEGISRVHLVLMMLGERVYAIDTASTNSTYLRKGSREISIETLDCSPGSSVEMVLGDGAASICWCPGNPAQAS